MTTAGFYVILRLIGYAQAGRSVSAGLALKGEQHSKSQAARSLTVTSNLQPVVLCQSSMA